MTAWVRFLSQFDHKSQSQTVIIQSHDSRSFVQIQINFEPPVLSSVSCLRTMHRKFLGQFRPVRRAGLEVQARLGPARGPPGPLPSLIQVNMIYEFELRVIHFNFDIIPWNYSKNGLIHGIKGQVSNSEIKRKTTNYSLPISEVSGFDPPIWIRQSMKSYHYATLTGCWFFWLICWFAFHYNRMRRKLSELECCSFGWMDGAFKIDILIMAIKFILNKVF